MRTGGVLATSLITTLVLGACTADPAEPPPSARWASVSAYHPTMALELDTDGSAVVAGIPDGAADCGEYSEPSYSGEASWSILDSGYYALGYEGNTAYFAPEYHYGVDWSTVFLWVCDPERDENALRYTFYGPASLTDAAT